MARIGGEDQMLHVDEERCRLLGQRLREVRVWPEEFIVRPTGEARKHREANLLFYLVAICQNTKTLQGAIDGKWYRGWDYMVQAARRAITLGQYAFHADQVREMTGVDLRRIFSDDLNPDHSTIDRVEERVWLIRDCGDVLVQKYDGDVWALYEAAHGRLRGDGGILERMSEFVAYSDPVEKKSFLFLMYAIKTGLWKIADPENLKVAIDYHVMRIALRAGMVEVDDRELERRLKGRRTVTAETDNAVRAIVRDACDRLIQYSGHSVFDVDNILWMMGRNCCFYDHDPICGDNPCFKEDRCTFIRSIEYQCSGKCLFDGLCRGSREEEYECFWETKLYTHYY